MSLRVCSTPGCPTLVERGKCGPCSAEADALRGSPRSRGYDAEYEGARAKALASATHCFRCDEPFTAENPATGGHLVAIRKGGTTADGIAAECQKCNYGRRG